MKQKKRKRGYVDPLKRAERLRESGAFTAALPFYRKALKRGADVAAYFGLGGCLRLTGDFKGAIAAYKRGLAAAAAGDTGTADALMGIGMSKRGLARYNEAERYLLAAGRIYLSGADLAGIAFQEWCLAGLKRIRGDLKGSLKLFLSSLKHYRTLKDKSGIAYAHAGTGGILRMLGRYKDSSGHYERASRLFLAQSDRFGFAYCNCGMGSAARMAGDAVRSERFYGIALKNYGRIKDEVNIAFVRWGFANTLLISGRIKEALIEWQKSDRLFKKHDDKRGKVYSSLQKAEIERLSGDLRAALGLFEKARVEAKRHGLSFEVLHAKTGLALCGKGKMPYKEYRKLGSTWPAVLKGNTPIILNFP